MDCIIMYLYMHVNVWVHILGDPYKSVQLMERRCNNSNTCDRVTQLVECRTVKTQRPEVRTPSGAQEKQTCDFFFRVKNVVLTRLSVGVPNPKAYTHA